MHTHSTPRWRRVAAAIALTLVAVAALAGCDDEETINADQVSVWAGKDCSDGPGDPSTVDVVATNATGGTLYITIKVNGATRRLQVPNSGAAGANTVSWHGEFIDATSFQADFDVDLSGGNRQTLLGSLESCATLGFGGTASAQGHPKALRATTAT